MTEQEPNDRYTKLKEADTTRVTPGGGSEGPELSPVASGQSDVPALNHLQPPAVRSPDVVSHSVPQIHQSGPDISHPQGIRSRWANSAAAPVKEKVVESKSKGKNGRILVIVALLVGAPILAVGSAVLSDPRFTDALTDSKESALLCRAVGRLVQPSVPSLSKWFFTQSYALNPSDTTWLVDLAYLKQRSGEIAAAKADYEHLLTIAPNARIWNNVGNIYLDEGDQEKAIKAYTNALALDPNWQFAYYNRAGIYNQQRKYQQALDDYAQAIKRGYATAYFRRAELYKYLGKHDLAARDLNIIQKHNYIDGNFGFMKDLPPPDEL